MSRLIAVAVTEVLDSSKRPWCSDVTDDAELV
jgi:hypothetical protein